MDKVKQSIKKLCDSNCQLYGFRCFNGTYARIKNDMLQSFSIIKTRGQDLYNVYFGIVPLCNKILSLDMHIYSLDQFYDDTNIYSYGWSPDMTGIEACTQRIIMAIEKYLLPLFLKCNNCKEALNELIAIETIFESNRNIVLQREQRSDCAEHQWFSSMFDPNKYCLAMKARDYNYMQQHLKLKLSFYNKRIYDIKNGVSNQPDIVYQNLIRDREETRIHLLKLEEHDAFYFDQLIASQELKTTVFLKERYPKLFEE